MMIPKDINKIIKVCLKDGAIGIRFDRLIKEIRQITRGWYDSYELEKTAIKAVIKELMKEYPIGD